MPKGRFRKLPRSILRTNDQRLLDPVAQQVVAHVENPDGSINHDRFTAAPPEAQVLYMAWRFQGEAGADGMEVFVLEPLGIYSPEICEALEILGAKELVRRLRAAVALARNCSTAEFKRLQDQRWFESIAPDPHFRSFKSINRGVYPLIWSLTELLANLIRSNADTFFERR